MSIPVAMPPPSGEPSPSGATPRGAAASGEIIGAPPRPIAGPAGMPSDFTAAAVSAFKSINPQSSRDAAVLAERAGADAAAFDVFVGFEPAADVSALSENNTDDSFRAPVPPPPRPDEPASGALVATSSSLPALSMPPNRSAARPRDERDAARDGEGCTAAAPNSALAEGAAAGAAATGAAARAPPPPPARSASLIY
jgi:hypothetical protein